MKRTVILIFILSVFILLNSCYVRKETENYNSFANVTSLEYYKGTEIPTFDSVTGKSEYIKSDENFAFAYGKYTSLEEAKDSMIEYCELLKNEYEYSYKVFANDYAQVETKYGTIILGSIILKDGSKVVAISLPEVK